MKKNKEWAKKEIKKIHALTFDAYEAAVVANNKHFQMKNSEQLALINKILEILNQLDEPEVLSEEWIDNNSINASHDGVTEEYVHVDDLQNLLVPKQEITQEQVIHWIDNNEFYDHATAETVLANAVDKGELGYYGTKYSLVEKPVLPKHVVNWIEENREYYENNPLNIGYNLYDNAIHPAVDNWITMNEEKFMRAWLDGYTVEKEQKYYARIKGWELFVDFVGAQYWGVVSNYGRLGFVSADDAKDRTKDEWNKLGINDSNADFVEVAE